MTQELQELLERIRKEGVDKARIEAEAMLATARQAAEALLAKAAAEAEAVRQAADRDAEAFGRRGEQSVRQAARDVLLEVRCALDEQFDRLLRGAVAKPLREEQALVALVKEAVTAYLAGGEQEIDVRLGGRTEALAATLTGQLRELAAGKAGLTVSSEPDGPAGFTIRLDGGRVEHSFTEASIAAALARLLRPQLAALLGEKSVISDR